MNRKASNYAPRGERQVIMHLEVNLANFPCLFRFLKEHSITSTISINSQIKTIAKQVFLLSKELYHQYKESFYSNMINTITSYSNTNNNPIDLETKIMNSGSVEIMKHIDHYVSFWKQQILKSTKPSFYST